MRLLIVAPKSDLDTHAELLDAGGDDSKILHGLVSVREVLDQIRTGEFDALHFAGHGDQARLQFSDGLLDAALLGDAIRSVGGLKLVLVNSCESLGVALGAYMNGANYAIGWQDDVANDVAVTFSAAFWASWKMGGDVSGAYRTGREAVIWGFPGRQVPALLNGRGEVVRAEVVALRATVDRLTRLAWGLGAGLGLSVALNLIDVLWLHW